MIFFGTKCVEGDCTGVVVLTGPNTMMGGIATLAQTATQGETTLSRDIKSFAKFICTFSVIAGLLFFALGFAIGTGAVINIIYAIGIIVGSIPEGLPVTLTVSLAAAARRLADKKVLVKNLQGIETLGSTSCICTDKTGTLTQNRMVPSHTYISGKMFDCSLGKDECEYLRKKGEQVEQRKYDDQDFVQMMNYLALCSSVVIMDPSDKEIAAQIAKDLNMDDPKEIDPDTFSKNKGKAREKYLKETLCKDRSTALGNATEAGMLKFVASVINYQKVRDESPLVFEIPFKSSIKYNVMVRKVTDDKKAFSHYLAVMKGAGERVTQRCNKVFMNGKVEDMTDARKKELQQKNDELAGRGERVLSVAYLELDPKKFPESTTFSSEEGKKNAPTTNLVFYGLISLYDPPRIGIERAVDRCHGAGIKIIMVTGDQPETAKAIAHRCHIITNLDLEYGNMIKQGKSPEEAELESRAIVIHGDELLKRHQKDVHKSPTDPEKGLYLQRWLMKKEIVFARLNPAQKLIIVEACQKLGHIVAVTGDGVNDSPAIEQANIGIAMGGGSDVAKDAADMVLMTDDFPSIVVGVEEGRLIFDNLKKSITYTLGVNTAELGAFVFYIIFQVPLPLTAILMLFITVGTDLWPAISFAYEPPELDIMNRKPRNPDKEPLVGRKLLIFAYVQIGFVEFAAGLFAYYSVMSDYGFKPMNLFFYANKEGCIGNEGLRIYDWHSMADGTTNVKEFYRCPRNPNPRLGDDDYYVPESKTLDTISPVTNQAVRYTSEALKYAQTSYWCAIVVSQWGSVIARKTRSINLWQHGFSNRVTFYALVFETILAVVLVYVPFLNTGIATRRLDLRHFGVNAFPFFTIIILYDEVRKFVMNRMSKIVPGKKAIYSWIYRNTFY